MQRNPKVVSFDCAGTLLNVRWDPAQVSVNALLTAGGQVDEEHAYGIYSAELRRRWKDFRTLNLSRDISLCDEFWRDLSRWWHRELGTSALEATSFEIGYQRIYSRDSDLFQPFDDTVGCLARIKEGFRCIVLSNWDCSLHRLLKVHNLTDYFELVIASLEIGIEKPDPALFSHVQGLVGVNASEILHVGDHLIDDLQGARNAGWDAVIIDRNRTELSLPFLSTLDQLPSLICNA